MMWGMRLVEPVADLKNVRLAPFTAPDIIAVLPD
jgi:hypothetical protein